jgi:surface polysaccharide O-acyltransferase-like enzyme
MTQSKSNSRNMSVETFRLLAMFFVIIPHLEYPNVSIDLVANARLLCRWVLPFFYIVSGYFFAEKCFRTKRVDSASVIDRLGWIFIVWNLIYIPIFFMADYADASSFLKLITSPGFIFLGDASHLWFISSLLFGYLFVSFCYRNNATILLAVISVISVLIVLYAGSYYVLFDAGFNIVFNMPRHWLSVPFLYLGFLFFQKGRPGWQTSAALLVFGVVLQVIEARFLAGYGMPAYKHQFLIGSIPFGIGVAGLALSDLKYLQHPLLGRWGSEYSLGIYVFHPWIGHFVALLVDKFLPAWSVSPVWQASLPITLFILSLIVLVAIHRYLPAGFNFLFGKHAPVKEAA